MKTEAFLKMVDGSPFMTSILQGAIYQQHKAHGVKVLNC